jgi:hypothetical protein
MRKLAVASDCVLAPPGARTQGALPEFLAGLAISQRLILPGQRGNLILNLDPSKGE